MERYEGGKRVTSLHCLIIPTPPSSNNIEFLGRPIDRIDLHINEKNYVCNSQRKKKLNKTPTRKSDSNPQNENLKHLAILGVPPIASYPVRHLVMSESQKVFGLVGFGGPVTFLGGGGAFATF